ncbi:MAG: cupin domain-containing protein [Robiginitalea sp.]|jgi:quercetin dioxygenase-like cupin family protein
MKKIAFLFSVGSSLFFQAQNPEYSSTSSNDKGTKAPNAHYIRDAWLNGLFRAGGDLNHTITKATIRANSTLDRHKYESPQVLVIVQGEDYDQERGKEPIIMKAGDVIKFDMETEHWH